jgi:hypothetical protein
LEELPHCVENVVQVYLSPGMYALFDAVLRSNFDGEQLHHSKAKHNFSLVRACKADINISLFHNCKPENNSPSFEYVKAANQATYHYYHTTALFMHRTRTSSHDFRQLNKSKNNHCEAQHISCEDNYEASSNNI